MGDEEISGQRLDVLLPEDAVQRHRQAVEHFTLEEERSRRMADRRRITGRRKDGTTFPVEASISKLQKGDALAFTAIVRDITVRHEAEELLARQADQLKRSNAELEEFAYVASHDLSEPLRAVAGFVQLIAQRYEGQLNQEADEFISFALEGVRRMQSLIQHLLTYSRVSRHEYTGSAAGLVDISFERIALSERMEPCPSGSRRSSSGT